MANWTNVDYTLFDVNVLLKIKRYCVTKNSYLILQVIVELKLCLIMSTEIIHYIYRIT